MIAHCIVLEGLFLIILYSGYSAAGCGFEESSHLSVLCWLPRGGRQGPTQLAKLRVLEGTQSVDFQYRKVGTKSDSLAEKHRQNKTSGDGFWRVDLAQILTWKYHVSSCPLL